MSKPYLTVEDLAKYIEPPVLAEVSRERLEALLERASAEVEAAWRARLVDEVAQIVARDLWKQRRMAG